MYLYIRSTQCFGKKKTNGSGAKPKDKSKEFRFVTGVSRNRMERRVSSVSKGNFNSVRDKRNDASGKKFPEFLNRLIRRISCSLSIITRISFSSSLVKPVFLLAVNV